MEKAAVISPCGKYRYYLSRIWDNSKPTVLFIMFNPSTADHEVDDPTIRRCIGFAKSWDCGGLYVVNLFARRDSDPRAIFGFWEDVGEDNDAHIRRLVNGHLNSDGTVDGYIVIAWGGLAHPADVRWRRDEVIGNLPVNLITCLGVTKSGEPKHPLYVPASTKPIPYQKAIWGSMVYEGGDDAGK